MGKGGVFTSLSLNVVVERQFDSFRGNLRGFLKEIREW